jgi:hypothetical protein
MATQVLSWQINRGVMLGSVVLLGDDGGGRSRALVLDVRWTGE